MKIEVLQLFFYYVVVIAVFVGVPLQIFFFMKAKNKVKSLIILGLGFVVTALLCAIVWIVGPPNL